MPFFHGQPEIFLAFTVENQNVNQNVKLLLNTSQGKSDTPKTLDTK